MSKNTGVGETKNLKKPSQTSRGVLVGLKVGFKPHKEYRPISKKPHTSSTGNNKKGVECGVSTGTTPITDKIEKFEDLLTSRQAILMDEASNPLKNEEFVGDYDYEDEVASVDNDMACYLASKRVDFVTQSLLR
nr:hypothetical protein [Tanacetum cinerariifolium]